jgi:hypothetical protein
MGIIIIVIKEPMLLRKLCNLLWEIENYHRINWNKMRKVRSRSASFLLIIRGFQPKALNRN